MAFLDHACAQAKGSNVFGTSDSNEVDEANKVVSSLYTKGVQVVKDGDSFFTNLSIQV